MRPGVSSCLRYRFSFMLPFLISFHFWLDRSAVPWTTKGICPNSIEPTDFLITSKLDRKKWVRTIDFEIWSNLTLISSNRRKIKRRKETGYREETRTDVGLKKKRKRRKKRRCCHWLVFFGSVWKRRTLTPARVYYRAIMYKSTCKSTCKRHAKRRRGDKRKTSRRTKPTLAHKYIHPLTRRHTQKVGWLGMISYSFWFWHTHIKKKTIQINLYIVATARGGWQWTNTGDWSLEGSII